VVTHQLQVERRTAKGHRPKTDALPLDYATNPYSQNHWRLSFHVEIWDSCALCNVVLLWHGTNVHLPKIIYIVYGKLFDFCYFPLSGTLSPVVYVHSHGRCCPVLAHGLSPTSIYRPLWCLHCDTRTTNCGFIPSSQGCSCVYLFMVQTESGSFL